MQTLSAWIVGFIYQKCRAAAAPIKASGEIYWELWILVVPWPAELMHTSTWLAHAQMQIVAWWLNLAPGCQREG